MNSILLTDKPLSVRAKALQLGVSYGTARNRTLGAHNKTVGRQQRFNEEEEQHIKDLMLQCSGLGVSIGKSLLKKIISAVAVDKGSFVFVLFSAEFVLICQITFQVCRKNSRRFQIDGTEDFKKGTQKL